MSENQAIKGPDFSFGISTDQLPDGATVSGHTAQQPILVSRRGEDYFAVSAACTHYGGPLGDGLVRGERVLCPWHHACFDLRSGEALTAPAFAPLARWRVEVRDGKAFVREQIAAQPSHAFEPVSAHPGRIVIVGGGAAGFAAAEMLRRRGFAGALTLLDADAEPPTDRPNLSKDYLAGAAQEDWIPLRDAAFYSEQDVDLRLGVNASSIDAGRREVLCDSGESLAYDRLLLATGASPRRLSATGFERENVYVLRTLGDARAIIAAAAEARAVAIVGASFIGLEVAASLRARGLDVHVIAPETTPMQRTLGPAVGGFILHLHQEHGVCFHLDCMAEGFDGRRLRLNRGPDLEADFVVLGVGVTPNLDLAKTAALDIADGVAVDSCLRTSDPAIFAAGDIARYRDPRTGLDTRVEHWVAAERQGQTAALNMLGAQIPHSAAPFFWSRHYEHSIHYVGHAPRWDAVEIDGSLEEASFAAHYSQEGRPLATAFLGRDREALELQHRLDEAGERAASQMAVDR